MVLALDNVRAQQVAGGGTAVGGDENSSMSFWRLGGGISSRPVSLEDMACLSHAVSSKEGEELIQHRETAKPHLINPW